jgi:hypothetical protein
VARDPRVVTMAAARRWLRGSAVPRLSVHCTDQESAEHIHRHGVQIARSSADAAWGQGFYSATRPRPEYGEVQVAVAVRLLRPWIVRDTIRAAEELDALRRRFDTDDPRAAILGAGFDGVVVDFQPGDLMIVAYWDEQVRVVEQEADE